MAFDDKFVLQVASIYVGVRGVGGISILYELTEIGAHYGGELVVFLLSDYNTELTAATQVHHNWRLVSRRFASIIYNVLVNPISLHEETDEMEMPDARVGKGFTEVGGNSDAVDSKVRSLTMHFIRGLAPAAGQQTDRITYASLDLNKMSLTSSALKSCFRALLMKSAVSCVMVRSSSSRLSTG